MKIKKIIGTMQSIIRYVEMYVNNKYLPLKDRSKYKGKILEECKSVVEMEALKDSQVIEDVINLYEILYQNNYINTSETLSISKILENLRGFIEDESKKSYGSLNIDHESYNIKIILYYENDTKGYDIAYMAGSFYTDQEYRTFLATIQKGKNRVGFTPINKQAQVYNLKTIKDGYISRVKKAINGNTQDGYHADFSLNNGRFFLLKENDNPIDIIYNWITKNTQAAVLDEWKTYLYNALSQSGHIQLCEGYNYTGINLRGMLLSKEVDTKMIREIRKEGMDLGEISIPRKPVELNPSMSFIDAMTNFIIPHITERKCLYNIGEELSTTIKSPIVYKKGHKLKKTYLYPKQMVIAQGLINGMKKGRTSLILNGGMGVGKTYISIKTVHAAIKEIFGNHLIGENGRVALYCQSHILPKWERQFKEAMPNAPLKFFNINGYKDVIELQRGRPKGIEVYLLPKDKVKRKYLEAFCSNTRFEMSNKFYKYFNKNKENENRHIFIANEIKPSEMKILARSLYKALNDPDKEKNHWVCIAKEIFNEEGRVIGYKIASTSGLLKEKLGCSNLYYDFQVKSLDEILEYKKELESEKQRIHYNILHSPAITCPCCGGFIYNREEEQLSADDYANFLFENPTKKTGRNKNCTNYIKADGTPLTSYERKLLIKGEIDYIIDEKIKTPFIDSDDNPITDSETIHKIKQGKHDERYTIVLRKCNAPFWSVLDKKGYRTVNSVDMLKRRFGKKYFDCQISDEAHLYSAESSQGETFGKLCRMSKVNLALTGTLTGGKASHMFYTLYRMIPHKMSKYYKYDEVSRFIDHYGRRKRVTKEYFGNDVYNKSGQGKVTSSGWNEIPGISPMLYSHFLSDIMISRKIEDMGFTMPPLKYYKQGVDMSPELERGYNKLKSDIISFMKANKHLNLGGTYLNALLSYPDMPLTEPLMYNDIVISRPEPIDIENIILPKEQALINTIKRERQQGRGVIVYIIYTGEKEVDKRIGKILSNAGFKVALLKSTVKSEKREQWIQDRYDEGVEVIVCNPKLVQTGLDIVQYPTVYFLQLDYDVRIVRQAELRPWRVIQTKDCKIFYSYYNRSIQYDALKLIGSKKKASLAIEGVFAEDLLSDMAEDLGDSGVTALYKSLLGKIKLKEDDLDFFSEEELVEIIEEEITMPNEPSLKVNITIDNTQLSLFTVTEESLKKSSSKMKKKVVIGQVSMFEF